MTFTAVWIDSSHARLFTFSEDGMRRETLHAPREEALITSVTERLSATSRILLLGPGTTRQRLFELLEGTNPTLARRVVGNEASDTPSDHQIAAIVTKFLQKPVS